MKKLTILFLSFFICSIFASTYGQTQQSAKDVWKAYKEKPQMYTFLDALVASAEPKTFIPYFQEFINTTLDQGVQYKVLKEEFTENILNKDPEVATFFGICLALKAKTIPEAFSIFNMLPKKHKYYNGEISNTDIDALNQIAEERDKTDVATRPEIKNLVIMPDGRILYLRFSDVYPMGFDNDFYSYLSCSSGFFNLGLKDYTAFFSTVLYNPNGESWVGIIRKVVNNYSDFKSYEPLKNIEPSDSLWMSQGYILNKEGNVIGDKYYAGKYGFCSYKKFEKIVMKQAMTRGNKQLISNYGEKAYEAIYDDAYYVGLPEGAILSYNEVSEDGNSLFKKFVLKGTYRDAKGSYKVYVLNSNNLPESQLPTLTVRNGKVVRWKNIKN